MYSLYVMDYGAPIGFRIAASHPERVQALIVQNGNAYEEGLRDFWEPIKTYWNDGTSDKADKLRQLLTLEATRWQYTNGVRNSEVISPDNWNIDQRFLDRPGNNDIQLALFYDYRTNPPLYPQWQEYFRSFQPPTLVVWGKNDYIFPAEGAHPYQRELKDIEVHLLDTGHFALEEDGEAIAHHITRFLSQRLQIAASPTTMGGFHSSSIQPKHGLFNWKPLSNTTDDKKEELWSNYTTLQYQEIPTRQG